MNCQDIQKNLKLFLDDLLIEKNYQGFVEHVESCPKCKTYVHSIDSFSNQIWKLGNVKVPQDLLPSILFELSHPRLPQSNKKSSPFKLWAIGVVFCLMAGFLIYGVFLQPNKKDIPKKDSSPKTTSRAPVSDEAAQNYFNQLQTIAANLEKTKIPEDLAPQKTEAEVTSPEKQAAAEEIPQAKAQTAPLPEPAHLHWHVRLAEKLDLTPLDQKKQEIEDLLTFKKSKKEQLAAEIKKLEAEIKPGFGESYQEKSQTSLDQINELRKILLDEKLSEQKTLTSEIQLLNQQKARIEEIRKEILQEVEQKKLQRKKAVQKSVREGKNRKDLERHGIFLFEASGKETEKALESILASPDTASYFRDFTQATPTLPEQNYSISIYLEDPFGENLHWRFGSIAPEQKGLVLDIIKDHSSSIAYQAKQMIAFYISKEKVKKLRQKIQAMRIPFTEFGDVSSSKKVLSSGPIPVSIYFQDEEGVS